MKDNIARILSDGKVYALVLNDGTVYAGGDFTSIGWVASDNYTSPARCLIVECYH
jgi:hypothetical protein